MRRKAKSLATTLAKLLIAAATVWFISASNAITTASIVSVWRDPLMIVVPIGLLVGAVVVASVRWWLLLVAQDVWVSLVRLIGISFVAHMFANLFIGMLGGEVVRMAYLSEHVSRRYEVAALVLIVDRVCGLLGLLLLSAIALSYHSELDGLWWAFGPGGPAAIIFGALLVMAMTAFLTQNRNRISRGLVGCSFPRVAQLFARVGEAMVPYVEAPRKLVIPLLLSVVTNGLSAGALVFVCVRATDALLPTSSFAVASLLGQLSSTIPITPAGIGVGEIVFDRVCRFLAEDGIVFGFAGLFLSFRALALLSTTPGLLALLLLRKSPSSVTQP